MDSRTTRQKQVNRKHVGKENMHQGSEKTVEGKKGTDIKICIEKMASLSVFNLCVHISAN